MPAASSLPIKVDIPIRITVRQDFSHSFFYNKESKRALCGRIMWYTSSSKFPIRSLIRTYAFCGPTFIFCFLLSVTCCLFWTHWFRQHPVPHHFVLHLFQAFRLQRMLLCTQTVLRFSGRRSKG